MKTHAGEKPYKYSHCDKAFSHRSNLNSNFRKYSREKLYQCSLTNKTFFTQWCSFIDIGRLILGRNPTNAAFVTSHFSHRGELKRHIKTHSRENPYQCSNCDKAFIQRGHLKSHIRKHSSKKLYQCRHCDKGFQKYVILTVILVHTLGRNYIPMQPL